MTIVALSGGYNYLFNAGDFNVILSDDNIVGCDEIGLSFLASQHVDPTLINMEWIRNHYRWIVWKLASMELKFPQLFARNSLTPLNVLEQLKYRYDVEVDHCKRSALKRIIEQVRDILRAHRTVLLMLDCAGWYCCENDGPVRRSSALKFDSWTHGRLVLHRCALRPCFKSTYRKRKNLYGIEAADFGCGPCCSRTKRSIRKRIRYLLEGTFQFAHFLTLNMLCTVYIRSRPIPRDALNGIWNLASSQIRTHFQSHWSQFYLKAA